MRLATIFETPAILKALHRLQEYAAVYQWAGNVDFTKGSHAILDEVERGNAYIVDGYLVMVAKVQPWYTKDFILQEWLVLKVYDGYGTVDSVPNALLDIAKERGCSVVISADSSPVSIVAKAYADAGFEKLTQSFFMEVP